MQLSRTGQLKHTGLVRSWFTDLTLDSNELLGVTFRPWRKLHISQISTILHTAYRGINTWQSNTVVNNKWYEDEDECRRMAGTTVIISVTILAWISNFHSLQMISLLFRDDIFTSHPGGCCWSWGGSQAGRRTLGSAPWHPPCCPWRLTPTPSWHYKTCAPGCRSLPVQRWDTTQSYRCVKLCNWLINNKRIVPDLL